MIRVLVTGASGLLGTKLVSLASSSFEVIPSHNTRTFFSDSLRIDLTNREKTLKQIVNAKPNVIIHLAAETNVDKCEKDKETAWAINVAGTKNVAEASREISAKMVYVSTDYVFDGEKGQYVEEDATNPVNYYGLTKLKGEEIVRKTCKDYLIARPSVIYGWHPWKSNFAAWTIMSLRRRESITIASDHYNSPTLADNLAEALLEMIKENMTGLYHVSGSEQISRFGFATKIAEAFNLNSQLIRPVKTSELKVWIAKRPRNSSLQINKAQKQLATKLLNIQESLERLRKDEPLGEFHQT